MGRRVQLKRTRAPVKTYPRNYRDPTTSGKDPGASVNTLPFIKFFPNDWLADEKLRTCSLPARGLWMDVLSLMWKSPRRGYLESAECVPLTLEQLSRVVGDTPRKISPIFQELERAGVFSREEETGVIFSRRIVREEAFRRTCSEAGRKGGGNPALKGTFIPTFKGLPKGTSKGDPKPCPKPQKFRSSDTYYAPEIGAVGESASDTEKNPTEPKPRNELLETLASIDGSDLTQLTQPAWARAGKALKIIREVCPSVSADEVRRRADNYRRHYPTAALTSTALASNWAKCDRGTSQAARAESLVRQIDLSAP